MVKVPIWAYYCINSYVTTRARSTRVLQYCHFDNFVLLTSSGLDGDYVPIPTWKYNCWQLHFSRYAGYLDKCRRQQNKEILIRHSPGIGECFFAFKYSINRKNKKFSSGGCKNASQRFVLCKGVFDRKK